MQARFTFMPESLIELYRFIAATQMPSAIPAKMSLLVALYLVQTGNIYPGRKLLTAVLLAHFAMSGWIALGYGGAIALLTLTSFGLVAAAGYSLSQESHVWKVLPESDLWRWVVIFGYAAAFLIPFDSSPSLWKRALYSPMATLPQPTLLALLVLASVSVKTGPKTFIIAAAVAGGIIGLLDVAIGNPTFGSAILVGTIVLAVRLYLSREQLPVEEEAAGKTPNRSNRLKDQDTEKGGRSWDLR